MSWYDDAMQLRDFADALVAATDIDDPAVILAKPYKYTNEFIAWKNADFPGEDDPNFNAFVDALGEVEEDESDETE